MALIKGRIRNVKPELFRAREVCELPIEVRWTFLGLLVMVDDEGVIEDDARLIKADIYALDDIAATEVYDHLSKIQDANLICRYEAVGRRWLHVLRFRDDWVEKQFRTPWGQKPQRAQPSRFPPCPYPHEEPGQGTLWDDSMNDPGSIRERSRMETHPIANSQEPIANSQLAKSQLSRALARFDEFYAVYPPSHGPVAG